MPSFPATHKVLRHNVPVHRPDAVDHRRNHPWRRWYKLAVWRSLREDRLRAHPLCERCEVPVPATVVNHRKPHRGVWALFIDPSNLEAVCKPCHDAVIQREEAQGYSASVDVSGHHIDPRHPARRHPGGS